MAFVPKRQEILQMPSSGAFLHGLLTGEWVRIGSEESLMASFANVILVSSPTKTTAQPNPALNGLGKDADLTIVDEESTAGSVLRIYW